MYRILFIALILLEAIGLRGQTLEVNKQKGRKIDSLESKRLFDSLIREGINDVDLQEMYKKEQSKKQPNLNKLYKLQILKTIYFSNKGIIEILEKSRNSIQAARVVEFDAKATNYDRYRTSPCFNTLGFNPLMDSAQRASIYAECEKAYYAKFKNKILVYVLIFLVIAFIVFVGTAKKTI